MKFPKLVLTSLTLAASISGADYPRWIILLAPSITRNLFLLGAGDRIVGVTVYCREYAQNAGFLELGRIIGDGQRAAEIILAARKRVNAVKSRVLRLAKLSLFWELGTKPVFTACRASFINDFLEIAGGRNVFFDLGTRYSQVSREEVVRRNPDIIIIAAPNEAMTAEKQHWGKFPAMNAVKYKKIFILEDRLYTEPSPLAFAQAVENIAEIIHPRGKKQ